MAQDLLKALKKLAELPTATEEDKRAYQTALFKSTKEYSFEYVTSREEFKSRLWMIEQFDEQEIAQIKKRYNNALSIYKTRLQKKKAPIRFYIGLVQNKCAQQWFEKTYDLQFPQNLTLRCLNLYNLNRMEQKWIVVGYMDEYAFDNKVNKFDIPLVKNDLVFVTYYDNKFVLFGAAKKEDYNRTANPIVEQGLNKIIMATQYFDDNDTLKSNEILKNIEINGYDPAPKKLPKIRRDVNRRTMHIDKELVKKNVAKAKAYTAKASK